MAWRCKAPAFIIGGGPSLASVDIKSLAGRGNTIAINSAFQIAPFADVLFFADRRFFSHYHAEIAKHPAPRKISRHTPEIPHAVESISVVKFNGRDAISFNDDWVCGLDSGANAINLAFVWGANPIYLFGFDMKPTGNWHPKHPFPEPREAIYREKYIPGHVRMSRELARLGVSVFNCSHGTALTCYPVVTFSEVLANCPPLASSRAPDRRIAMSNSATACAP